MATTKKSPQQFFCLFGKDADQKPSEFSCGTNDSFILYHLPSWELVPYPLFFQALKKVVSASQNQKPRHFCRFTGIGPYRGTA